jgi:hypothetical protein
MIGRVLFNVFFRFSLPNFPHGGVFLSRYDPYPRSSFAMHDNKFNSDPPWSRSQQYLSDLDIDPDWFINRFGCIRWYNIRAAYFSNYINKEKVKELYCAWRDTPEYLWLDGYDIQGGFVKTCFVKAAKRGNDVYKDRLNKKFKFLEELPPIWFIDDSAADKRSPMIFVTLTVDPKKYSLDQAWDQIGMELHIFETKLRQKYGSFVKIRVWESHESGFPHVHLVYYFHNYRFIVFEHFNNSNDRSWRIVTKDRNIIANFWSMGNVDIQAVEDTLGALNEVDKYITKNIWSNKGDLTNAMLCLHRKQAYHISSCDPNEYWFNPINGGVDLRLKPDLDKCLKKDFVGSIWGQAAFMQLYNKFSDGVAEPSSAALVTDTVRNCNIEYPEIVEFRFVGCFLYADLVKFMPDLKQDFTLWGDPPPELKAYLGLMHNEFRVSFKTKSWSSYSFESDIDG